MKKFRKVLFGLMLIVFAGTGAMIVHGEENTALEVTELSQFLTAKDKIEAKAEPDEKAETVITYDAGSTIYVTGQTQEGWISVSYQGQTGYINMNIPEIRDNLEENEIDVAALDKEMEAEIAEGKMIIEEVERYRAEKKRSRIWGTVIVLLVAGIFAMGIVSGIQAEKAKKQEGENNDSELIPDAETDIIDLDKED
ncbi:MAG: hypothetical protein HDR17_09975 [Lachnospiraceae bacterium]|nr:hypothetical protein [Lachnospiraceae bacterium]